MEVFDVHHHFGSHSDVDFTGTADEWVTAHIDAMDRRGVTQAALMPSPRYANPDGLADTREMNDRIAYVLEEYPDRFPVGFGTVELRYGERGLDEVDRIVGDLGLDGLTWHSRFQGGYTDDDLIYEYIERAAPDEPVIALHALARSSQEQAWRVFEVVDHFDDLDFLVLDGFVQSGQNKFIFGAQDRYDLDNALFETSFMYNLHRTLPKVVDALGIERIAFGSDVYSDGGELWATMPIEQVRNAGLTEDEERALLWENAARTFGL